jgi:hypothetical protein
MPDTAILWEWLSFAVRWTHVITAIAWIGSSFYFIALDLGLRKTQPVRMSQRHEAILRRAGISQSPRSRSTRQRLDEASCQIHPPIRRMQRHRIRQV